MKKWILPFVFLFLFNLSWSQSFWVDKTADLNFLYSSSKPVSAIYSYSNKKFLPANSAFYAFQQRLIKNKKGLFLIVDGTGQVYKAADTTKTKLKFVRIDSTFYIGYNFNAICFSHNDSIFSFGGMGFWQNNGQLRNFEDGNEWNSVRINKAYQADGGFYYYDLKNAKLFWGQRGLVNEIDSSLINQPEKRLAVVLDIKKKQNTVLGALTEESIKFLDAAQHEHNYSINAPSLDGKIIRTYDGIFLVDFNANFIYKLSNQHIYDQLHKKTNGILEITFEYGDSIYYSFESTKEKNIILYSTHISKSDFAIPFCKIYEPLNNSYNFPVTTFLLIFFIVAFLVAMFFVFKFRKKTIKQEPISEQEKSNNSLDFSELEKMLIAEIIDKSLSQQNISVEFVNKILGLSKKSIEVQKRTRTEAINNINHKFKILSGGTEDLIERIRLEGDKRFVHYIIKNEKKALYIELTSKLKTN